MLVGLGFDPRYAAGLCLVANTAPVAFGSIGIPLITASQVTGLDLHALSQMVGRQLPLLSLIVPFYLVALMAGWRGIRAVWPAALVSGGSFAVAQFLTSNLLGPMLPDIISSVVSILALVLLLRVWQPADTFRFAHEGPAVGASDRAAARARRSRAWSPFLVLTLRGRRLGRSIGAGGGRFGERQDAGAVAPSGDREPGNRGRVARGVPLQLARRIGNVGLHRRGAVGR